MGRDVRSRSRRAVSSAATQPQASVPRRSRLATAISAAMVAGSAAGLVTALLNVRFRILNLLASILTTIAAFLPSKFALAMQAL